MTAHQLSKRKNQVRSVRVANPKHNLTTKPKNGSCLARGIIRIIVSYILFQVLGFWLVLWNMAFIFPYLGNFIIPTDEIHHFQRGRYSTNKSLLTIINSYNNHMIYIYIYLLTIIDSIILTVFFRGVGLSHQPGCFLFPMMAAWLNHPVVSLEEFLLLQHSFAYAFAQQLGHWWHGHPMVRHLNGCYLH